MVQIAAPPIRVPDIPRPPDHRDWCWTGNPAKAGLERCNLPRGHQGPHSWERAK